MPPISQSTIRSTEASPPDLTNSICQPKKFSSVLKDKSKHNDYQPDKAPTFGSLPISEATALTSLPVA